MQQQVPAVQVERRTVELLEIQIQSQLFVRVVRHSSFSTATGNYIANQADHCGDSTGGALERSCDSGLLTVVSLRPVKDVSADCICFAETPALQSCAHDATCAETGADSPDRAPNREGSAVALLREGYPNLCLDAEADPSGANDLEYVHRFPRCCCLLSRLSRF